jgi:hypothetical protein
LAGTATTLVLVAQHTTGPKKGSLEDKNMLAFGKAWAALEMGCTAATCVKNVKSYPDLIATLKAFTKIENLAVLCHSGGDTLEFPDEASGGERLVSMADLIDDLSTDAPQVDNLDFLGCQVGKDPLAMWDLGEALGSKRVFGYNYFHGFQPFNLTVDPAETEQTLRDRLGAASLYVIPNTDLAAIAAKHRKGVQVWIEWFRVDLDRTGFDKVDGSERAHTFKERSSATPKRISSHAAAVSRKAYYLQNPVPPLDRLEVGPPP